MKLGLDKLVFTMGNSAGIVGYQCGTERLAIGDAAEGMLEGAVATTDRIHPLHDEIEAVSFLDGEQAHFERYEGVPHRQPLGWQGVRECLKETLVAGYQDAASGIAQQYGGKKLFTGIDVIKVGEPSVNIRFTDAICYGVADCRHGCDSFGNAGHDRSDIKVP